MCIKTLNRYQTRRHTIDYRIILSHFAICSVMMCTLYRHTTVDPHSHNIRHHIIFYFIIIRRMCTAAHSFRSFSLFFAFSSSGRVKCVIWVLLFHHISNNTIPYIKYTFLTIYQTVCSTIQNSVYVLQNCTICFNDKRGLLLLWFFLANFCLSMDFFVTSGR